MRRSVSESEAGKRMSSLTPSAYTNPIWLICLALANEDIHFSYCVEVVVHLCQARFAVRRSDGVECRFPPILVGMCEGDWCL
jgi:hypothetical protein